MRLQTLAGLERKKIEDELAEKIKLITYLNSILDDAKNYWELLRQNLKKLEKNIQANAALKFL